MTGKAHFTAVIVPGHARPERLRGRLAALTLRRFCRQRMNSLHRTLSSRGDPRPRREPGGFCAGLLLHPRRGRRPAALARAVLMGLSQVATVLGHASERRSER